MKDRKEKSRSAVLCSVSPMKRAHTHTHIKSNNKNFRVLSLSRSVQSAFIFLYDLPRCSFSESRPRTWPNIYRYIFAAYHSSPSGAHTYLNTFVTVRSNMTCIAPSLSTQNTHRGDGEIKKDDQYNIQHKGHLFDGQPAPFRSLPMRLWRKGIPENETKHRSSTLHGTHHRLPAAAAEADRSPR